MNKKLEAILKGFDDADLLAWSDKRSVARAKEYVGDVHDVVALQDGGVTAKVDGTHEYLTTIFLDSKGNVQLECSCPVADGCKHGVALAIKCRAMLKAGEPIKTLAASDQYWRELRDEFGEDMKIFGATRPQTVARQSAPLARIAKMDLPELQSLVDELMQNVEAVRPYLARKFALEDAPAEQIVKDARRAIKDATQEVYDGWHYRSRGYHGNDYDDDVDDVPDYGLVQDYFARLAKLGKIKELMQLCDYFVKRATEQMNASGDEDDVMFSGIQRVVAVVAHAVFASGLADSEKLLWEYRRETCDEYGFLESDSDQTLNFWKRKGIKRETWSQVADALLKDCQVSGEEREAHLSQCWPYLMQALKNAGRGAEAVEVAIATCDSLVGHQRVVEALYAAKRIDEAAEWCRKALAAALPNAWQREDFTDWLRRFAAERGDWQVAAAYDVADFLRRPNLEDFSSLEGPCRKAGVWEKVREIILECLATGEQPLGRKDWPLPVPEYGEPEIAAKNCPMAELLCRIALREKRPQDAARWFDALVGRKTKDATLHQIGYHQELAFAVAAAIAGALPEDAVRFWKLIIDANCQVTGERYYEAIVRALTAMKPTLAKLSGEKAWRALVAGLAEKHHRRRNLVKMLEKLQ